MIKIELYQIDMEADKNRVCFNNYGRTVQRSGGVDPKIYKYAGAYTLPVHDLEAAYDRLNTYWNVNPITRTCRSCSVSDVINVTHSDSAKVERGFYFVDSIGFQKLERFDVSLVNYK